MNIIHKSKQMANSILQVFVKEIGHTFRDEGVIVFFLLVPLVYPMLYAWIYNNQQVRDVPAAVVDLSHSHASREFIRAYDATPEVSVAAYCNSIEEAQQLMARQEVKGILLFPADYQQRLYRGEQAIVSLYVDMSVMLNYKSLYQAANTISSTLSSKVQVRKSGAVTQRDEQLSTAPVHTEEVPIFLSSGGYADFIIPGVMVLIIHQTLLLGIGLSAGTASERRKTLAPRHNVASTILGKALCYIMIYLFMSTFTMVIVPHLFGFVQLLTPGTFFTFLIPFLLASTFFGMTCSCGVKYRENVLLLVVFASVPLLFLSGISWPQSAIPPFWEGVASLFPSTFGVRAFVRLNTMGASIADVQLEYHALWIQAGIYFLTTCAAYRWQRYRIVRKLQKQ